MGIENGALYTDFYELTMAQLYFRMGMHERGAQFDYFFRSYPDYGAHQAGYCLTAGMQSVLEWMKSARFGEREVEQLRSQTGRSGEATFSEDFLTWLKANGCFDRLRIEAVAEGRVVHPEEPVAVVTGPLAVAQLLESSMLNHLNYQSLIATKASRIKLAGQNQLTIEFGMRRAQGLAANEGVRGALIGGADFSSNTGMSCALGFPPKGTHAHSMVQAFIATGKGELEAFRAYAKVYPDDCILLVDTIDTLGSGIPNAIRVFEELTRKGHKPVGVRLDSGDLAYLSIQAAKALDQAGFQDVSIVLSNKLDEMVLMQIIRQVREEAPRQGVNPDKLIDRFVYGVGTRLITSRGAGSLDGVYKLVAIEDKGEWAPAIKLSETPAKIINPGYKKVWRLYSGNGLATADCIAMDQENLEQSTKIDLRHPLDFSKSRVVSSEQLSKIERLHEKIWEDGKELGSTGGDIAEIRKRRDKDLESLDTGVKRIVNPHQYHVSLSRKLWKQKRELIATMKGEQEE